MQMEDARRRLHAARERRVHPLKDDKILTSWNGLMIAALAKGYQVLGDRAYADAARKAADFILETLRDPSGRLLRRYRRGHLAHRAYLDDYAFLVWGLVELYESIFDVCYLEEALRLNREMLELFWDDKDGGCFFAARDGEALIVRDKDLYDGACRPGTLLWCSTCCASAASPVTSPWNKRRNKYYMSSRGWWRTIPWLTPSSSRHWTSPLVLPPTS